MFVQVIRAQVADEAGVRAAMEGCAVRLRTGTPGFLGATGGISPDGEFALIARFESADAARRHSEPAAQGTWWSEIEGGLKGPVSLAESGEVDVSMGGGSNKAGFVQAFTGHGQREEARAAMVEAEPILRRERPDIMGGFTVWFENGRFLDVAYFRSESAAREGESKGLSEEGRAVFEQFGRFLAAEEYLDLPDPILI